MFWAEWLVTLAQLMSNGSVKEVNSNLNFIEISYLSHLN